MGCLERGSKSNGTIEREINVPIKVDDIEFIPTYQHPGDAGADLRAAEEVFLRPGRRALIGTGVRLAIPWGYVGLVMPRSGLANKGVMVIPGTIDAGYRGEVKVLLHCFDCYEGGFQVRVGDRIAQLEILPVMQARFEVVEELPASKRGNNGFGSTGI